MLIQCFSSRPIYEVRDNWYSCVFYIFYLIIDTKTLDSEFNAVEKRWGLVHTKNLLSISRLNKCLFTEKNKPAADDDEDEEEEDDDAGEEEEEEDHEAHDEL